MTQLDAKDEILLMALERNARASVVALAAKAGLSRSATQERLARLERTGVIAGYTIRRGEAAAASARLRAWLLVRYNAQGACSRAVSKLKAIPQVRSIDGLAGEVDLLVEVDVASSAELEQVGALVRAAPGVSGLTTHLVLSTHIARPA